jgi:NAD+ diphosphatase
MRANSQPDLILGELALARGEHDRGGDLRTDDQALQDLWAAPGTKVLRLSRGRVECVDDKLVWVRPLDCPANGDRFFLGMHDGVAHFAFSLTVEPETFPASTLRELGATLSASDVGLVVHAVALSQWHALHTHCARCGAETLSINGGASRKCVRCDAEHYPRTDPAVIVLIRDKEDRILLGRQAVWPTGRFSTFAGFVEPGESFEAAVHREILEEAGVEVEEIAYLGSQPWPFPASIMIAFSALTPNPENAKPDGTEIDEVRWFSRDELQAAIADQSLILPPSVSVARKMIEAWFGGPLHGGEAWR